MRTFPEEEMFKDVVREKYLVRDTTPKPEEKENFAPYLGPLFNLHRNLKANVSDGNLLESWVPDERL